MILSKILARRRIAAGERPSLKAAWLPVIFDIVAITLVLALLWTPLLTVAYLAELKLLGTILLFFLAVYLPFHLIVAISTTWAVRSRWKDE